MKKHKYLSMILLVLLLCFQALPVMAMDPAKLVNDDAGILSAQERDSLEDEAKAIETEYGLQVRIAVVPSMSGQTDAYEFAKSLYKKYDFGSGEEKSGILLMLSMEDRDYALIAHGEGNNVLTDYGNEKMVDSFLPYFGEDDWVGGFRDYLETAEDYCYKYYVEGEAYDVDITGGIVKALWGLAFIGSPLIALLVVGVMINGMKTAKEQTDAELYVGSGKDDAFTLRHQSDDYLYTQTIVTPHPESDDSSGGTTIDSDGFSGSSGKF